MSLYTTAVSVANVWTSPEAPRRIDRMMLENPVHVRSWLDALSYEERLELCTANLVQTQVLFGEDVQLLQERGDWAFVIIPGQPSAKDERGYPGWIPKDCLVEKSPAKSEASAVIQKPTAFLYDDKKTKVLELSFLTKLPVLSSDGIWFEVDTPLGRKWLKKGDADLETPVKGRRRHRSNRSGVFESALSLGRDERVWLRLLRLCLQYAKGERPLRSARCRRSGERRKRGVLQQPEAGRFTVFRI